MKHLQHISVGPKHESRTRPYVSTRTERCVVFKAGLLWVEHSSTCLLRREERLGQSRCDDHRCPCRCRVKTPAAPDHHHWNGAGFRPTHHQCPVAKQDAQYIAGEEAQNRSSSTMTAVVRRRPSSSRVRRRSMVGWIWRNAQEKSGVGSTGIRRRVSWAGRFLPNQAVRMWAVGCECRCSEY